MLKVGDKVRVIKGLKRFRNSELGINEDMLQFEGEIVTIIGVEEWGDTLIYIIKEDEEEYYWVEEMFEKIEEKESNNMKIKEMTLNEILDSILEGELEIEEFDKRFGAFCYEKGMEVLSKQFKRPQYTFQEAFEAFEKVKEIESCFSKDVYKKRTNGEPWLMNTEEIKGKW